MLKFVGMSRCGLCTMVTSPSLNRSPPNQEAFVAKLKELKDRLRHWANPPRSKRILVRVSQTNIRAVRAVLEKHNVDTSRIKDDKRIFSETQWTIEKRILLLKEMGVSSVTTSQIVNFMSTMYLPVSMYKAHLSIDPDVNLAEKLLSNVESTKIDRKALNHLDEQKMIMRLYYNEILVYYLQNHLELTNDQVKRIHCKKYTPQVYNSFKLLERLLKLVKDLKFSNYLIIKNYHWLFGHHPDHAEDVLKMIKSNYENLDLKLVLRYPRVLRYDLKDLQTLFSSMKHYKIESEMIQSAPEIFHISSTEFKMRMENMLKNPFTLVYQRHPRFLHLIRDYQITLPRIKYLQEKNIKFATIHTLTTFHNYLEQLTATRKMNRLNLMCFFELQFGDDAEKLFIKFKKHPYYQYSSLVQMYETLVYLRKKYPIEIVYRHIYAILYSKTDLKAAYENIMEDPELRKVAPKYLLSMCLYKIESISHFTGDAVLSPEKYSQSLKDNADQEEHKEEESKEK